MNDLINEYAVHQDVFDKLHIKVYKLIEHLCEKICSYLFIKFQCHYFIFFVNLIFLFESFS